MKISILIVNWNTRDLLIKCVDSVLEHAQGLDFEVIVVDNHSSDNSADALTERFGKNAKVRVIRAEQNLGFAGGNNRALKSACGEYILLLNPDTIIKPGAIHNLARFLDEHPETAVVGPRLLNPDNTIQPSVRQFPGLWSSLLIFSGLHRFLRPRRYLMDDFDYSKEAEVDQVMGAALLTRRGLIEKLGFLDEGFYLWYEEVDFCRRVKRAGWQVRYFPVAEVIHQGAQSFSQLETFERKRVATQSLRYYFRKNGSRAARLILALTMPLILGLAFVVGRVRTFIGLPAQAPLRSWFARSHVSGEGGPGTFFIAMVVMAGAELLSFLTFEIPSLSVPLLVAVGLGSYILTLRKSAWGMYLLFGELFVGSRGHLLEAGILSLRIVVFASVFAAWLTSAVVSRKPEAMRRLSEVPRIYWILIAVIGVGAVSGFFRNYALGNVFFDANGYFYLLILPAVLVVGASRAVRENILQILAAAVAIIGIKTFWLFVWFGYNLPGAASLYHWIISFDIGEITGIAGGAPRVFMQSQFYAVIGLLIFSMQKRVRWLIVATGLLSVVLGLSRSLWLGAVAGLLFGAAIMLFRLRFGFGKLMRWSALLLLILVLEIGSLLVVAKMSPQGDFNTSVRSRVGNPVEEASGGARLLLLPELLGSIKEAPFFGSGFGKEVEYKSYLPDRVTEENPDGVIKSFAFEWGYLDILLKLGLLGLVVYLLFIAHIFRRGWESVQIQDLGILAGLVALIVLNTTTPYLNHPLGIGYLIFSLLYFKDAEFPG